MKKLSSVLIAFGVLLIAAALFIFIATFYNVFLNEVNYQIQSISPNIKNEIVPVNKDFGIVIPKISANAKIIPNVDPYNDNIYQVALTKGVAHASGTVFPGQDGNVFLFSHSSVNFYEASRYNSIFYLIDKLTTGDEIILYYKGDKYTYKVIEKKLVGAGEVKYLGNIGVGKTLTLMTCWPPGTTFKRLIVIAILTEK